MSLTPKGNPEHMKAAFWIACMEAQIWEMKEALATGDFKQFGKEFADCYLVACDGLRLMGYDAFEIIFTRFAGNISKFTDEALKTNPRDTAWYLAKIEKIKAKLGVPIPCNNCPQCGLVQLE